MPRVSDGVPVPDGQPLRIDTISAYVCLDPEDDTEGIPAFAGPGGVMYPMVMADHEMLVSMRPKAIELAAQLGLKVSLVRWSHREVLLDDITKESDA